MLQDNLTTLGRWTGYTVDHVVDESRQVTIHLQSVRSRFYRCSKCGRFVRYSHDYRWRTVRDLPAFGKLIILRFQRRRVDCRCCGPRLEYLDWIKPDRRSTFRLETYVADLCSRIAGQGCLCDHRVEMGYGEEARQSLPD